MNAAQAIHALIQERAKVICFRMLYENLSRYDQRLNIKPDGASLDQARREIEAEYLQPKKRRAEQ